MRSFMSVLAMLSMASVTWAQDAGVSSAPVPAATVK